MYRRPKFLEILLEIRRGMAHEADYDVDLFAEIARSGKRPPHVKPRQDAVDASQPINGTEEIPTPKRARRSVEK